MTLQKEVTFKKNCSALTKTTNTPCRNGGKWLHDGQYYCHLHAPRKQDNCVICLSPMINAYYLACGHYFHKKCITKWMKRQNTCPTCRELIFDTNLMKSYQDIFNKIDSQYLSIAIDIAIQCRSREEFLEKLTELDLYK